MAFLSTDQRGGEVRTIVRTESGTVRRLQLIAALCAGVTATLAAANLLGWAAGSAMLTGALPKLPPMRANAALGYCWRASPWRATGAARRAHGSGTQRARVPCW
ncbi:MAG TPA: hypothetical protein VMU39_06235 [Solirubrobacteraceae bacterium]|nr:hypothetical protein [Solirubrobacteraceae bacterium]